MGYYFHTCIVNNRVEDRCIFQHPPKGQHLGCYLILDRQGPVCHPCTNRSSAHPERSHSNHHRASRRSIPKAVLLTPGATRKIFQMLLLHLPASSSQNHRRQHCHHCLQICCSTGLSGTDDHDLRHWLLHFGNHSTKLCEGVAELTPEWLANDKKVVLCSARRWQWLLDQVYGKKQNLILLVLPHQAVYPYGIAAVDLNKREGRKAKEKGKGSCLGFVLQVKVVIVVRGLGILWFEELGQWCLFLGLF